LFFLEVPGVSSPRFFERAAAASSIPAEYYSPIAHFCFSPVLRAARESAQTAFKEKERKRKKKSLTAPTRVTLPWRKFSCGAGKEIFRPNNTAGFALSSIFRRT
jgi:hypothetical protein